MAQYVGRYCGLINENMMQFFRENLTQYNVNLSDDGTTLTITDNSGTGIFLKSTASGDLNQWGVICGENKEYFSMSSGYKPHLVLFSCKSGFIVRFGFESYTVIFDIAINSTKNSFATTVQYSSGSTTTLQTLVAKNGVLKKQTLATSVPQKLNNNVDKNFILQQLFVDFDATGIYFVTQGLGENTVVQTDTGKIFVGWELALPD